MADQTLAKFVNQRRILTLLRTRGALSRAELSRSLGLTQATISRLTSQMIKRGHLREVKAAMPGKEREPGRPGIALEVDPVGAYFVGVEIGVSTLRIVLLDLSANVAEAVETKLASKPTPQVAADAIATTIKRFAEKASYRGRVVGVGVTVPGLVTSEGFIVNLPILGWKNTDFRSYLMSATDLPVTIENNANAAAFGAVYTQPGLVAPYTVFLKLGTGCGGAAIVNGRLLRGVDGTGLELGHIHVGEMGAVCSCGQRGCLETWVNLAALSRAWTGEEPGPVDLNLLPDEVASACDRGDARAIGATSSIAQHLATGLVSLINVFNPAQVVLGGAMIPVLRRALAEVKASVATRIIPGTRMPDILISPLGAYECAIGAACISHHVSFDISNVEIGGVFEETYRVSPGTSLTSKADMPAREAASNPSSLSS